MNIDSSAIMALFSAETADMDGFGTWLQQAEGTEAFNGLFQQQLAVLQQNFTDGTVTGAAYETALLQNLATADGIGLPDAAMQEVNLEEMQAVLADILRKIGLSPDMDPLAADQTVAQASAPIGLDDAMANEDTEDLLEILPVDNNPEQNRNDDDTEVIDQTEEAPALLVLAPNTQIVDRAEKRDEDNAHLSPLSIANAGAQATSSPGAVEPASAEESLSSIEDSLELIGQESQGTPMQDRSDQEMSADTGDNMRDKNFHKLVAEFSPSSRLGASEQKTELPALNKPFYQAEWGNDLAERLVFMHKQEIPSAQLNLNPRHLGPVAIRIDVNQDQTSIAFSVQHAAVKEAVEAAIPKLREMLGNQQLNLIDVNVSQQQSDQRQATGYDMAAGYQFDQEQFASPGGQDSSVSGEDGAETHESDQVIAGSGLLNLFA